MKPLVSLGIPTFNRARFLKKTLPTLRAQTYEPLEILISDNASTDETEAFCRKMEAADSRIRYLRQTKNIGLYPNHNALIDTAQGEYLCFFHDDELYSPRLIEKEASFLEVHPEVGLVCSNWDLIDEEGKIFGSRRYDGSAVLPGRAYVDQTTRSGRSWLNCPGTMIRRAALGGLRFQESGPTGFGDFALWFEIAEDWAVGHIGETLWQYRIHRSALSSKSILAMTDDFSLVLERYFKGCLDRRPTWEKQVAQWREAARRYVFFSLLYEILRETPSHPITDPKTIFDSMGYFLKPQELQAVLERLNGTAASLSEQLIARGLIGASRLRLKKPIGWILQKTPNVLMRRILGFR